MARQSFSILGRRPSEGDEAGHSQLFGHLSDEDFTAEEAAEYLEVSLATFARFVHDGTVSPSKEVGRCGWFSVAALKAFKRQRKAVRG